MSSRFKVKDIVSYSVVVKCLSKTAVADIVAFASKMGGEITIKPVTAKIKMPCERWERPQGNEQKDLTA